MQTQVFPNEAAKTLLESLVAVGHLLDEAQIDLTVTDFELDPTLTWDDLELPTFTGYTAGQTISWPGTAFLDDDNIMTLNGASITYIATALPDTQVIHGYTIHNDDDPPKLYMIVKLPEPIVLDTVGEGFVIVPEFKVSPLLLPPG